MNESAIIEVTALSAARAVFAATLATGLGVLIARQSRRVSPWARRFMWAALLAAIVSPDLVAGYAYANFSLSLARQEIANEVFVALLIAAKASGVAAVIAALIPAPALSPGGRHAVRLAGGRIGPGERLRILMRGRWDRWGSVWAISFLFAFGQFELPSLTNTTAWTVTLFDRQTLLPDLADSADPLIWPLLVELLILAPLVVCLARAVGSRRRAVEAARFSLVPRVAVWLVVGAIVVFSVLVPWSILAREAVAGAGYFGQGGPNVTSYTKQIGNALLYGVLSGGLAWLAAVGLLKLIRSSRWRVLGGVVLVAVCVPVLSGALVPSLFVVEMLQTSWLLPLRQTIVPVVVVLALMLLPRAVLLEILFRWETNRSAVHLAAMLRDSPVRAQSRAGRERLWALRGFGRFCRVALLMYWGYLDLTVSSMLAPIGMESVTLWLYNFMHYGRNASLSAMTFVAMVVPVVLFSSVLVVRRVMVRVI